MYNFDNCNCDLSYKLCVSLPALRVVGLSLVLRYQDRGRTLTRDTITGAKGGRLMGDMRGIPGYVKQPNGKCGGCGKTVRWSVISKAYLPYETFGGTLTSIDPNCPGSYDRHWPHYDGPIEPR